MTVAIRFATLLSVKFIFCLCRFHLGEFKGSIHDCEITLGLNAYHFGAMVGQVISLDLCIHNLQLIERDAKT